MFSSQSFSERMSGDAFHIKYEPLTFSEDHIDLTLTPGEVLEGSFQITAPEGRAAEGFVSSSRACVQCLTETFSGASDTVMYRADASAFSAGDELDGCFRIISNNGEYALPYHISVQQGALQSSIGPVPTLSYFANLAKANWHEAVQLFYSEGFQNIFTEQEEKERGLYDGLSVQAGNEQNVEEFLIATQKKQPVQFLSEVQQIRLDLPYARITGQEAIEYVLRISKNGWGYISLKPEIHGDFLSAAENILREHDFTGSSTQLRLRIETSKLHAGKNYGQVLLLAPFAALSVPVVVSVRSVPGSTSLYHREKKELNRKLMERFEEYRSRRIRSAEWVKESAQIAERLSSMERDDPAPVLYQIHALVTDGDAQRAQTALDKLLRRLSGDASADPLLQYEGETSAEFCYRIYLTSLLHPEDAQLTADVTTLLEEYHKREPGNWRIAWLLLYYSEEYSGRPSAAYRLMAEEFSYGSRSPVIYLEAYFRLAQNPSMLMELDSFAIQLLLYAARKGLLMESVLTQLNNLSRRERMFSTKLYKILCSGYEQCGTPSLKKETLESICALLVRGNRTDEEYHDWYRRGVEEGLQITRLFEYFMLSLPEDFEGEIPRMVLMYFAYQCSLPWKKTAALYRYVHRRKEQFPDLYLQYEPQIERFALEQIMAGRTGRDLGYLQGLFLRTYALDLPTAQSAVPLAFTAVVRTNRTMMKNVILRYAGCRGEEVYPLENGTAYLPVYGDRNQIFFEDHYGMRYAQSCAYTFDRMLDTEGLAEILAQYDVSDFGFDMYLSGMTAPGFEVTAQNAPRFLRLAQSDRLLPDTRRDIRMRLLKYYEDNDCLREMDSYLMQVGPEELTAAQRGDLIRYLVKEELCEKALDWVRRYGTYGVSGDTLVRLCTQALEQQDIRDDAGFAQIAFDAYQAGRYNQNTLWYLGRSFEGLTSELEQIRGSLNGFDLDDYALVRRELVQILYSGAVTEHQEELILRAREGGADTELLAGALAQVSHLYVTAGGPYPPQLAEMASSFGLRGVPLLDICRIAWLKYCAESGTEISPSDEEVVRLFLGDLLRQEIIFPFFRQFIGFVPELAAYADQTLVEYAGGRGGQHVVFHYAMDEDDKSVVFTSQVMKEMYEGIYVTGFLLFFGEQMHYFITDDPEEKNIVESGTAGQDVRVMDQSTQRFGMINSIAMNAALMKSREAYQALREYSRLSYLADTLFEWKKE